jgi:hypothetical protein
VSTLVYKHCPHYHGGNTDPTRFDLHEVTREGQPPMYVMTESELNRGSGFDSEATRDAAARNVADYIREHNNFGPGQVILYQQRPDGDFERVGFREYGRDGQSETDREFRRDDPELYQSLKGDPGRGQAQEEPAWGENQRTLYTRADLENALGERLEEVPAQTPQQRQDSLNEQWRDLSGPATDRPAEVAADQARQGEAAQESQQRSQEQAQQMNQHQQQHYQSQQF